MEINRQYVSEVNTYPGKNSQHYIVVHETDNLNNGAGAKRHAEAQYNGNLNGMSAHYYCGSDGIYQAAGHEDGTWSVGKEYGGNHSVTDASNLNTINIEICVNPDGDYNKARANAVKLVKHLIKTTGIPAERVIRHFDAKGKYCPRKMMDNPALWEDFKNQIGRKTAETFIYDGVDYSLVFDPAYYSDNYLDLKNVYGTDAESLFHHFISFGMKEARQASENFNVGVYKNAYVDLQNAFGSNLPAYYKHYVQYGHKEGRVTVAPKDEKEDKPEQIYRVQVGAYTDIKNAEKLVEELKKLGYADAFVC